MIWVYAHEHDNYNILLLLTKGTQLKDMHAIIRICIRQIKLTVERKKDRRQRHTAKLEKNKENVWNLNNEYYMDNTCVQRTRIVWERVHAAFGSWRNRGRVRFWPRPSHQRATTSYLVHFMNRINIYIHHASEFWSLQFFAKRKLFKT